MGIVREGDQAVDAVCEGGDVRLRDVLEVLPNDFLDGLESEPDDHLRVIAGCGCENHENRLPARLYIPHPGKHHLGDAPASSYT